MTENENQERINYLEREIFILDMKDHWDYADYSYMHQLKDELEKMKSGYKHD